MRPGLSTPCGSKLSFTRAGQRRKAGGSGSNTSTAARTRGGRAHRASRGRRPRHARAHERGACASSEAAAPPRQAAGPVVEHLGLGSVRQARGPTSAPRDGAVEMRQTPRRCRARPSRRRMGVALRAMARSTASREGASSSRCTSVRARRTAPRASSSTLLRCATEGATPSSRKAVTARAAPMRFGNARRRAAAGRCAAAETSAKEPMTAAMTLAGGGIVKAEHQNGHLGLGARQHLERHVGHRRERAPGAGEQLAEVVAGDVLHHAAAGLEGLAAAGNRGEAEKMVARGAGLDAPRAGEVGGEHAADRARSPAASRAAGRNPSARRRAAGRLRRAAPRSRRAACRPWPTAPAPPARRA